MLLGVRFVLLALPVLVVALAVALLTLGGALTLAQEDSTQDQAIPAKEDHLVVLLAQNRVIRCKQVPCYGTGSHDLIYERKGNGNARV
jgi:hypothetical protein